MAELTLKSRIVFRKDTAANWSTRNPILKTAEPGWDSTNSRLKIGNGTSAWSDLKWAIPNTDIYTDDGIIGIDYKNENKNGITRTFKIKAYANPQNIDSSTNHGSTAQLLFEIDGMTPGGSDISNSYYLSATNFYSNKGNSSLGSASKPWSNGYINTIYTNLLTNPNRTLDSILKIEAGSAAGGLTLKYNEVLPNRNGTSSLQGISLGSLDYRFYTGYFNEINLKAVSESYYVVISQMYNSPSDHGLQVKGSYNSSNALQICPDSGWIGKSYGSSGAVYFKTTGVNIGSLYSGYSVDFKLDGSTKAEIIPKYSGASPNRFSIGNKTYSFSSIYGRNLILNSQSLSAASDIDTSSRNILCLDDEITLSVWKSFVITGYSADNKAFTLDSVSGLEVGDTYSTACTGSVYTNYGQITAISGNTVTVSAVPSASFGSYLNTSPSYNHMCWYVSSKPTIGTTSMTYFSEVGTSNFIMVTNAKPYSYYNPANILNSNNIFCFGDGLNIPTNRTYSVQPTFKIGKYDNDVSGSYPFLIGWGTSDTSRKNIFYVSSSGGCYADNYYLISGGSVLKYKYYSSVDMYSTTYREKGMFSVYNPTTDPTGSATSYYGGLNIPLGSDSTTYVGQMYFERSAPRIHYHYSTSSTSTSWSSWYKIPVGVCGQITRGTSAPSGGRDGDIYLQY